MMTEDHEIPSGKVGLAGYESPYLRAYLRILLGNISGLSGLGGIPCIIY
jgi:hypothetical protein